MDDKLQFIEQKSSFFIGVLIESTDGNETEKRFYQRKITKQGNYSLQQVTKKAGVKKYG